MAYIIIENFAGGVDRSRPIYASNAGTLWSGVNGHMTRGGDFEKRKAFIPFLTLPSEQVSSYFKTYYDIQNPSFLEKFIPKFIGATNDANGIVMFINSPLIATPPSNLRVVLIEHPLTKQANLAGFANPQALAESIKSFEVVDGKIFCIVQFEDGLTFPFYDGEIVDDFLIGLDLYGDRYTATESYFRDSMQRGLTAADQQVLAIPTLTITIASIGVSAVRYRIAGLTATVTAIVTRTLQDGTQRIQIGASSGSPDVQFDVDFDNDVINSFDVLGRNTYRYNVEITYPSGTINVGLDAKPLDSGSFVKTYKRKMYMINNSLLDFSALDEPNLWDRDDDIGAGFVNISSESSGSDQLVSLEVYQDRLALFSRRNIQIWFFDPNPDLNTSSQILYNTGTRAPRSVVSYGDLDVFYLSDTGVRSIRARDTTNSASVNDVGTPIDLFILDYLRTLTTAQIESAIGLVEPIDSRYMLAVGRRIFVFSYFPSKKISAWSYYELPYDIDDFFTIDDKVYLRSGNMIYLLGGENNDQYGDDYEVLAQLPFLTSGKPATYKQIHGVDIAAEGEWNFSMLTNPRNLFEKIECGELDGVTLSQENIGAVGHFTHVAPTLRHMGAGYASLSSVAIHFQGGEEE